jgi:mono/diheme cytochrome c family protein
MNKRTFAIFAVVLVALAVAVPLWVFDRGGSAGSSPTRVADSDQGARELFVTNCGSCHILQRAGTDGVVGPDLDVLLAQGGAEGNEPRVLTAIENGVQGRMPAGILTGGQAEEVANFVARVAGQ